MDLATLKKLAAKPKGSAGRDRANKWLWSLDQRQWAHEQLKAQGKDSSNLLRSLGVLVPNEAGKLRQAEDESLLQWAYSYLGRKSDVPPKYASVIMRGQLVNPAAFFAAFNITPL